MPVSNQPGEIRQTASAITKALAGAPLFEGTEGRPGLFHGTVEELLAAGWAFSKRPDGKLVARKHDGPPIEVRRDQNGQVVLLSGAAAEATRGFFKFAEVRPTSFVVQPSAAETLEAAITFVAAYDIEGEPIRKPFIQLARTLSPLFLLPESKFSGRMESGLKTAISLFLGTMADDAKDKAVLGLIALTARISEVLWSKQFTPEQVARANALIAEAVASLEDKAEQAPSKGAPPQYRDRPRDAFGRKPNALEWFSQHWETRVAQGVTGDDIRRLDMPFYRALSAALYKDGKALGDLLPPSPSRGSRSEPVSDEVGRRRALNRERVRRHRERQSKPSNG